MANIKFTGVHKSFGSNKIITDFTTISARKNKFISEKSALDARPTACVEISASMMVSHT